MVEAGTPPSENLLSVSTEKDESTMKKNDSYQNSWPKSSFEGANGNRDNVVGHRRDLPKNGIDRINIDSPPTIILLKVYIPVVIL